MNIENENDKRQTTNIFLGWGLLALFALVVVLTYIPITHMDITPSVTFEAKRPIVYRVFAPLWVHQLTIFLPAAWAQAAAVDPGPIGQAVRQLAPGNPGWGLAALIVLYSSLLLALAGINRLAQDLGYPPISRLLTMAAIMLGLLVPFALYAYLYDLPTLALFTWALVLMRRGQYERYLIVFGLASLSKETAVLLILVYWLTSEHNRVTVWRVAEQAGVYLISRVVLMIVFVGHPGAALAEWHLPDFIQSFQQTNMGAYHLGLLLVVGLACLGWKRKPPFLRAALLGVFPALCGLYLLFGFPGEVRVFLEAAPIISIMLLPPGRRHGTEYSE